MHIKTNFNDLDEWCRAMQLNNINYLSFRKTKACPSCIARANLHQRNLVEKLRSGEQTLMSIVTAPLKDTVLLTDSDSDPEDSE